MVLALALPTWRWVLLDSNRRRTAFLRQAVAALQLAGRVAVYEARAEEAGRDPDLRGSNEVVVARSFGRPAVTAECAAPLLRVGGFRVVSEPPASDGSRWPAEGLARLGMERLRVRGGHTGYQVVNQTTECEDRFPRRSGIPAKRPLF